MKNISRPPTSYRVLMLLIILGSCVRIFVCLQHNPMDYLWSDPLRHWQNGLAFPRGGYFGASDPILFQVYIFVLQKVSHGNRIVVGLASALLSVLMPWTYYRAARDFGLRKLPALWVWLLITVAPSLLAIYHYLMTETLLLLLEGAALWMTALYLRRGGSRVYLASVFFWTLACLTKPNVIPLAGVCLLWSWWKKLPSFGAIAAGFALVLILLLPQAIRSKVGLGFVAPFGNPWLTRIQHRSGATTLGLNYYSHARKDTPSSALRQNVYYCGFTSPSSSTYPFLPFSRWRIRRASNNPTTMVISINSAYGAQGWKDVYDSLHVGWREWLAQWRENIVLFFFAPSWPEIQVGQWDDQLSNITRWVWAPLVVFVLVCNARGFLRRQFDLIPVVVTLFTLFLALQNTVTFEGRYRKPLEPLLLMNLVWILGNSDAAQDSKDEVRGH